jgi:hypothetical protein
MKKEAKRLLGAAVGYTNTFKGASLEDQRQMLAEL